MKIEYYDTTKYSDPNCSIQLPNSESFYVENVDFEENTPLNVIKDSLSFFGIINEDIAYIPTENGERESYGIINTKLFSNGTFKVYTDKISLGLTITNKPFNPDEKYVCFVCGTEEDVIMLANKYNQDDDIIDQIKEFYYQMKNTR